MRTRIVLVLAFLACAAGPAGAQRSVVREITVEGGNREVHRIVEATARAWRSDDPTAGRAASLEALVRGISVALLRDGWGAGTVEARLDSLGGQLRCRILLHGIEPTRLDEWVWDPPVERSAPDPGTWIPPRREEQLEDLLDAVREEGYPFASIQILEARGDGPGISVRARLREGPKLRLAGVRFEGAIATRPAYLERVAGLKRGEPIRPREAARALARLERTGLFSEVRGPWIRTAGEEKASLVYRMKTFPQNRIEGAVGYDGARQTLSGFIHLELGNLFGTGRRLLAAWDRLDRDRSSLDLGYREPYLFDLPLSAELHLSQYLEDSTWTEDRARGLLEADLGGWAARAGIGWERTVFSGEPPWRTNRLATILGLLVDSRSEAGTGGSRLDLEIDTGSIRTSPQSFEREGNLSTLRLTGERNVAFGSLGHLRVEFQGGWVEGPDSLPRPDALGVGGASSLRGYPERRFRALRFGLVRLEGGVRLLPEGNRIYAFLDGAVFRPWPEGATETEQGYGIGVRVRGAGGWVHLDYGIPYGEPPLSGRLHFRLESRF